MLRRWPSGARDGMRRRADGVRARGALSPAAEGRAPGRPGWAQARRGGGKDGCPNAGVPALFSGQTSRTRGRRVWFTDPRPRHAGHRRCERVRSAFK
jgi:hypothetical protein